jgi:hypothetical protein
LRPILNDWPAITDETLAIDPCWDKLRGTPEFEAVLAEATERIAQGKY